MRYAIQAVLVYSIILFTSLTSIATPISPYFVNPANGHAYVLLSQQNWTRSSSEAVHLGGQLVTINNSAEQDWVYQTFGRYGGRSRLLWIGLTSAGTGNFRWINGETLNYTRWAAGEPNSGGENYVAIYYPGHNQQNRWNDWGNATSDPIGLPFNGVVEFRNGLPNPSDDDLLAFTKFNESTLVVGTYTPQPGDVELGFITTDTTIQGNATAGPYNSSGAIENPIFRHRSIEARTQFDSVPLKKVINASFSILVNVNSTSYEPEDYLRVLLTDGDETIALIDAAGEELLPYSGIGYQEYVSMIPDEWDEAILVIESSTNSSSDAEIFNFDNVEFRGITIPEPSAFVTMMVLMGLYRKRTTEVSNHRG